MRGPGGSKNVPSRGKFLVGGSRNTALKEDVYTWQGGREGGRDTAEESEGPKYNGSGYSDYKSQCPEEELELPLAQLGVKVVDERINLAQTKHPKCLEGR